MLGIVLVLQLRDGELAHLVVARVAGVADAVAVVVGLRVVGVARAIVGAVAHAVAVHVVGVQLGTGARAEWARIALVALAVVVGVGLLGLEQAHRVEHGGALVRGVLDAVAVLVGAGDAVLVRVAVGHAARLAGGCLAEEERVVAVARLAERRERRAGFGRHAHALLRAAHVELLAARSTQRRLTEELAVTVEHLAAAHDQRHVLLAGLDDRA